MFGNKGRKPVAIQTLIGEDTRIEGDLRFEGGCHVDGLVNGCIAGGNGPDAYLSISEYGRVQGNVSVPRLALSGTVEGDVVVTERAELGPTAKVVGNVHYNLIEISAGAEINGKLIHEATPAAAKSRTSSAKAEDEAIEAELEGAVEQGG
ncbi:MAG: polymer-forming cytoskeletal protein [Gammaproteobacteria bacterium]|jgi:cytoskeletal protein CcmA (bactofilin family)|nr:polymer-forming cytoskeletal protein [Gammaproteobacteria bacterium]